MRLKTSYFSPAIFRKTISRFYLLVIFYFAAQCVALPLTLSTTLNSQYQYDGVKYANLMYRAVKAIYFSTEITAIIALVGGCAAAIAIFSYLYSARSANMMASLPIRREAIFVSSVGAVYAVVLISNVIAALFAFGVTMPMGLMLGQWILQWFGIVLVQFTLFFGLAVLCAVVTGSILAMPAIYVVVNFAAIGFGVVISSIFSNVMYGIDAYVPDFIYKLSPLVYLFSRNPVFYNGDAAYDGMSYGLLGYGYSEILPWYLAAGLIFFVIAFFIHHRRQMETAGDVVSFKLLRPVFKVLFTVGCGYIAGYAFYASFLDYDMTGNQATKIIVCVAIFSLIGYILAEMMVKKSTRISLKRIALPAVILTAMLVGGVCCAAADIFGREVYIPPVSDVKAAELSVRGEHIKLDTTEGIGWITALHQTILDDRTIHEDENNVSRTYAYITYEFNDGSELSRRYQIRRIDENKASDEEVIMNMIMNRPEAVLYRKQTSIPVTPETIASGSVYMMKSNGEWAYMDFPPEEVYELYTQCIFPDMQDGTIGLLDLGADEEFEFYSNQIEIYLYEPVENSEKSDDVNSEYFYTYPTNKSVRTNAWLKAHGVSLSKMEDDTEATKAAVPIR